MFNCQILLDLLSVFHKFYDITSQTKWTHFLKINISISRTKYVTCIIWNKILLCTLWRKRSREIYLHVEAFRWSVSPTHCVLIIGLAFVSFKKIFFSSAQNSGYLDQKHQPIQQQQIQIIDVKWMLVETSLYVGLSTA